MPAPSPQPASGPAPDCGGLSLTLPAPEADSREGRRVQGVLLSTPVLFERPDLLCAADEVLAVANAGLALTMPFVNTRDTLESLGIDDHNAWTLLAGAVPTLNTAAAVVEVAHQALLILHELSAVGVEMNMVVEAVHAFMQSPTEASLQLMKNTLESALPAHLQTIASIEAASRAVFAVADPARTLFAAVPEIRAEIDTWWMGKSIAHGVVDVWEDILRFIIEGAEAAAAAVDALADPLRERAAVMESALYPPEQEAPSWPAVFLLGVLASAAAVRRSRVRQH